MPVFDVQTPDGRKFQVDAPDIQSASTALQTHVGQKQEAEQPKSWGDVASQAITNTPQSAINFGKSIVQPFIHPVDTIRSLGNVEAGVLQKTGMMPGKEYVPTADAVGEYYKDRYGGVEQIKNSIATDPVGVAGDLSMILTGGGDIAERAPGIIGKIGEVARATGDVVNPIRPVMKGVEGVAGAAAKNPIVNYIRGSRDPEAEAARRFVEFGERDVKSGSTGLSPQDQGAARAAGQPIMNIDKGGEATRALARSAANISPEARSALVSKIADRFRGQGDRVIEWLGSNFDHPDSDATKNALDTIAKTINRPAYAKFYADSANGVWNEGFEQISQAPVVQDAIRKAMVSAKNEAAKAGFTPPKIPFTTDATGRVVLKIGENGERMIPNGQFWDIVKRALDKTGTREAKDWSRILRDHVDELHPSYADARAGAAKMFGAQDALEAGRNAATSNAVNNREMQAALGKMSPGERRLFRTGFVDDFMKKVGDVSRRRDVLNSISASPNATNRLKIALGSQKAGEFEAFLRTEGLMDLARNAVQGNSTTARQLAEMGLAKEDFFEGLQHIPMSAHGIAAKVVSSVLSKASKVLTTKVDRRVAEHLAKLLTSDDTVTVNKGVKIIAGNKAMMAALREFDKKFARVSNVASRATASADDANDRVNASKGRVFITDGQTPGDGH